MIDCIEIVVSKIDKLYIFMRIFKKNIKQIKFLIRLVGSIEKNGEALNIALKDFLMYPLNTTGFNRFRQSSP